MAKSAHRRAQNRQADAKRRAHPWRKLYADPRWVNGRLQHLAEHPLCVMCLARGHTRAATVVDHKIPHRGDPVLFFDRTNWQSLCAPDHDIHKQRIEARGFTDSIDDDGWPTDPKHPANAHQAARVAQRAPIPRQSSDLRGVEISRPFKSLTGSPQSLTQPRKNEGGSN